MHQIDFALTSIRNSKLDSSAESRKVGNFNQLALAVPLWFALFGNRCHCECLLPTLYLSGPENPSTRSSLRQQQRCADWMSFPSCGREGHKGLETATYYNNTFTTGCYCTLGAAVL